MSEYDGSWENDPLDLRCIRLDAEMEAGLWCGKEEDIWYPKTLEDCYAPEFKEYTRVGTCPPDRFLKPFINCFIINGDDEIVERQAHDPYHAKQLILKEYDESHRILNSKTLEFISLEEADEYE